MNATNKMLIEDVERIGREDTYGFQVDIRAGWSPTLDGQSSAGQFGVYALAGWQ